MASPAENREAHLHLVGQLRAKLAAAALGGPAKARERHVARSKLLPRDRVDGLLDPGSPFLEVAPLAADGMYDDDCPAAGIIAGIGRVSGQGVHDRGQRRHRQRRYLLPGQRQEASARPEIAAQNRLPCIYLVDSGGAFLPARTRCSRTGSISGESSSTRPT